MALEKKSKIKTETLMTQTTKTRVCKCSIRDGLVTFARTLEHSRKHPARFLLFSISFCF